MISVSCMGALKGLNNLCHVFLPRDMHNNTALVVCECRLSWKGNELHGILLHDSQKHAHLHVGSGAIRLCA